MWLVKRTQLTSAGFIDAAFGPFLSQKGAEIWAQDRWPDEANRSWYVLPLLPAPGAYHQRVTAIAYQ